MSTTNRWWEQYYVRYFVGTAVAIPLIILLAKSSSWSNAASALTVPNWLNATGVAAGGLAFCYLASTPILTMHMARSVVWKRAGFFQMAAGLLGAFTGICVALLFIPHTSLTPALRRLILLIPFLAVTAIQVGGLLTFVFRPGLTRSRDFYSTLARYRATPSTHPTPHSEFIESYRHLREHGNAVSIVTMELILAIALYAVAGSLISSGLILLAWLLPSAFAWFVGTWLEGSIDDPI
jgi:hypothetical protein